MAVLTSWVVGEVEAVQLEPLTILIWFFTEVIVTGLLVFLIQLVFQERMETRLIEFETRFSRYHERQADVIAKLYSRLVAVRYRLGGYVVLHNRGSPKSEREEELREFQQSVKQFVHYFAKHRIYLPKALGETIKEFCDNIIDASTGIGSVELLRGAMRRDEELGMEGKKERGPLLNEKEMAVIQAQIEQLRRLEKEMEEEFRRLLGEYNSRRCEGGILEKVKRCYRRSMGLE